MKKNLSIFAFGLFLESFQARLLEVAMRMPISLNRRFSVEFALRHMDPTVALPYWDSTLEKALPSEKDSMFFDESFAGTSNGVVTTGAFAGFLLPVI